MASRSKCQGALELTSAVLRDHLFAKVSEHCSNHEVCQQITDILFECPQEEIFRILEDRCLLEGRGKTAFNAIASIDIAVCVNYSKFFLSVLLLRL
jgi:hypothetical protein